MDRTPLGNDNHESLFNSESALSDAEKRTKRPCSRCGSMVTVRASDLGEIRCVDCRRESSTKKADSIDSKSDDRISLTGDDIVTVVCQLCRSSLLVNENKVGSQITCPDCHSTIVVQVSEKKPKRKTGSRPPTPSDKRQKKTGNPFDPDAELSLEEPAERPKVDPTVGFDEVTEDLLSAPLPDVDRGDVERGHSADPESDHSPSQESESVASKAQAKLTRRERYERVQRQVISDDRKEKRRQALAKKSSRKKKPARNESDGTIDDATSDSKQASRSEKRKRHRRRKGGGEINLPQWVQPALGWFRVRSMVIGWIVSTICLSAVYVSVASGSPLAWAERWWVMLTQSPLEIDFRLIVNSILVVFGSLYIYGLCGRNFTANAQGEPEKQPEAETDDVAPRDSVLFTTFQFTAAWLLAGLTFLYWSVLLLPLQFLIVPPLLFGAWRNRSVWKFVTPEGLIAPDASKAGRKLWLRFYGVALLAAALAGGPVFMMHSGGTQAVVGCLLLNTIMIAMTGVFGRHCRDLSKSLEPSP